MATEAVNGVNYDQYAQPVELAASTPQHGASASQSSNAAGSQKPDPQEIGWYFVEQYYTTLSKTPDKIHLFYNKKSQLITGTEAEKVLPAVGSKAISEKIRSLDISDCKIRVLNVDCQSSFDNIVVQVIGEMSNKNQPHHKFVQTFILATQPNGYFVLNDIFRYLSEDEDEIVEDEPTPESAALVADETEIEETKAAPTPAAVDEVVNTESAAEKVDEELQGVADEESASVEETNGTDGATEDTAESAEATPSEPAAEEAEPVAEKPASPEPSPVQAPAQPAATQQPPAPKSWASLVGSTKPTQIPALPQAQAPTSTSTQQKTQKPAQAVQPAAAPTEPAADTASTPTSQSNGWQEAGKKTRQQSKAPEGIVHAYIKNVNDKIDARVLREVLERYGKLKYYDVSRPKQCAFVEFEDPAAYTAAVAANPHTVGTETINVEERRPRPAGSNFNNNYTRGGGNATRGRGGPQQRAGSQGSGFTPSSTSRGNFQGSRGNKTPTRGRGQAQAA